MAVTVGNTSGQPNDYAVDVGAGAAGAVTQRILIATDQTAVPVSNASLPLPAGAATAAKQPALGTAGVASTDVITVQGIASGTPQPVSGTVAVSGTVPVSLATNTPTLQSGSTTAVTQATGTNLHMVVDSGTVTTVSAVTAITNALPVGANVIGKVSIDQTTPGTTNLVAVSGTVPVSGPLTDTQLRATAVPVSLASVPSHAVTNAGTFAVQNTPAVAASATLANVASSATSVTLQASNASRKGLICYNDSTQVLYLKFGATASTSSFTYYLAAGATWEMPTPIYTGTVDGIWASANGNARLTELA